MTLPAPTSFSPEQIAEFHRRQAQRPVLMRQVCDIMQLWRHCGDARCRRARSCHSANSACFKVFMQAMPDHERRMWRYAIENRSAGLSPNEAIERAQARVATEEALPAL